MRNSTREDAVLLLERVVKAQARLADNALAELVAKSAAQLSEEGLERARIDLREISELCSTALRLISGIKGVEHPAE